MNFREANLKVFSREKIPFVLFQPRIEPWYWWHTNFSTLPERYKNMSLLELFDELNVSMRYVHYYTGQPNPIDVKYAEEVKIVEREEASDEKVIIIETPYGPLTRYIGKTSEGLWRTIKHPVEKKEDFKKLIWLYRNTIFSFSRENFMKGSEFMSFRGYPQFFVPRSPYQCLCLEWMSLENLIYALVDYPELVEDVMKAIDESYDRLYEEIISCKEVKIVNFGENIDEFLLSERYFEKYLIPFYEKRVGQLKKNGIYTYIHMDGHVRNLLKYLKYLPFDGIEALTPQPQGDVSIGEIKEHIGDKILLDGIPAVIFLPTFSEKEFMECVEKIVRLFSPNLILGISDELPQDAPEESIERVKVVSEYCCNFYK